MKKLIVFICALITICSCGPSKEEKEKQAKEEKARIEVLAQHKADSIAKAEYEKRMIEEKQRAQQEEERSKAAEETKHWTGANSLEELKKKIVGTVWTCRYYGELIHKFEFSDGVLKKYSTKKKYGSWTNAPLAFSYSVSQKRDTDGNSFIAISFGDDSDLDHARQYILLLAHCTTAVWGYYGASKGPVSLTFGDFDWNDEL